MRTNTEAVKKAVEQARKNSTNDKSFEQSIKSSFNVQYCKLEKDSIKIADQDIKLSEIQHSKQDIIKDLQRNREQEKQAQQSTSHHQGYLR